MTTTYLKAGGGNDLLEGRLGDDTIDGGAGEDMVFRNVLMSQNGNDKLEGGLGTDILLLKFNHNLIDETDFIF